eukprot:2037192-Prymnesium_polylepis.1
MWCVRPARSIVPLAVARGRVGRVGRMGRVGPVCCELVHSHIAQRVSTENRLRECCGRVGRVGEEGEYPLAQTTVGERVGRVEERGLPNSRRV